MLQKTLSNGLRLLAIKKPNTDMAVVNILYPVGAIHESKGKTGLAHLLEHMMFEGSKNYLNFDETLQDVLGENNAFTTQEYTNYYEILPKKNIDIALKMEADRMYHLRLHPKKFDTQQQVVLEEFKETSIQPPLSDSWNIILKMAFGKSNYSWQVIGDKLSDVRNLTREDLKQFYIQHYNNSNAIISILSSDEEEVSIEKMQVIFDKPRAIVDNTEKGKNSSIPKKTGKIKVIKRKNIALDTFYITFHIPDFNHKDYFGADMISDLLSNGENSILYLSLIKDTSYCTEISSYITDNKSNNLLVIEGKINQGHEYQIVKEKIYATLELLGHSKIDNTTLTMLKNKSASYFLFNNYSMTNYIQNYSFYIWCDIKDPIHSIPMIYEQMTVNDIERICQTYFQSKWANELLFIAPKI